jgi:hypothetical protein
VKKQSKTAFKITLALFVSLFISSLAPVTTSYASNGNNGTIKIHEQGTPSGTQSNDPKVCTFNIEGSGFDANQTGYLKFDVQGGDKPTGIPAGPYTFGATNTSGYYATQYFNLQPGHYKATLYGKQLPNGTLTDTKAKSKVFKVTCEAPAGHILGTSTQTPGNSSESLPDTLPATGSSLNILALLGVTVATYLIAYKTKSQTRQ